MKLKKQNILYFLRTMGQGGTENVVLQLCEMMKPLVNKIIVCSCGGVNVDILNKMNIKHYQIPDIENKSIRTIVSVSKQLLYITKKENITVIHTHHRMAAFYVSLLCLYRKSCYINTAHNTFHNKKVLTKFSYKHATIVACGEMVKRNLVDFFSIPNEQITVIHNAVKPFNGPIIIDHLISELHNNGSFVVGNIGRLSKQKGMDYYIQAIPGVLKEHPNVSFLVIGSGEDEAKLKALVKKKNIESSVYFTGYRDDIQNIMSQLDLIVLSSLWEGFPLIPIEAFSVGKTIVATAVDGTVEIVDNGKTGILIEPQNYIQITDKINWSIEHPDTIKNMEQAAKQKYENEFSYETFKEKYINYYDSLE